ncbi:MAG: exo-alpha-sialidase [Pseudomonadota bacterium]
MFIAILIFLSLGLSYWAVSRDLPLNWEFAEPPKARTGGEPSHATLFDYQPVTGQAHSPSIVLTNTGFDVLWFEGSEEAQADVDIYAACFERKIGGWEETERGVRLERGGLGAAMEPRQLVVTLGNTIENEATGGLYATVVSVGGWAMASIADVRAKGALWARKLNLSPFINRSHLVKSPMVKYADGSWGLPAYFEMGEAHSLLVRTDIDGRVRDTSRIDGFGKPIQPMIVPLDGERAVAFLRDFDPSGKLLIAHTADGGQSWSEVTQTDLPNPSAPVATLSLEDGRILMVANDGPDGGQRLSLLVSEDEGQTWTHLRIIEPNEAVARYPMLRVLPDGEIAFSYSFGAKTGIRVHVFNAAWALSGDAA